MRGPELHTACESARCPNIGEYWPHRTAAFMVLGTPCTRRCGLCAVPEGKPAGEVDWEEPERVAQAARDMGLQYVVVTSVDRDDLADGGATIFAPAIEALRREILGCKVEVVIPDFRGSDEALDIVMHTRPGQHLRPSGEQLPMARFYTPDEFASLKRQASVSDH
jgi:lipoic acid synthetase